MKKKFVLTLALVLMVAVTLTAATPLEVSGLIKTGYTFAFEGSAYSVAPKHSDSKAIVTAEVAGDFWSVELDGDVAYGETKPAYMTVNLFLDKALAEEGVDMGDVTLTLHAGTGVGKGATSFLADKNDYRKDMGIKLAKATANNFGLTLGYADLVKVYFSAYPDADFAMVVGATVAPVDGVDVALAFSNDWDKNNSQAAAKALAASAKIDVAKLADLDFALAVTGEYLIDIDNEKSMINADVAGEYEGIGLWVAYNTDLTTHKLATKASYKTVIDKFTVGAGVKFSTTDLADIANKYEVALDASAEYKLGGATYALALGYGVKAEKFTITPTVSVSF